MGFFNGRDERVEAVESGLIEVKNNYEVLNSDIEKENQKLKNMIGDLKWAITESKIEIGNMRDENEALKDDNKKTIKRIEMLEELVGMMKKEKEELKEDVSGGSSISNESEWLRVKDVAEKIGISNETIISYHLSEKGVLDVKVNITRNSFEISQLWLGKLKEGLNNDKFRVVDGKLEINKKMISYFIKNKNKMKEQYKKYLKKSKTFKDAKKRIDSNRVEDYKKEVNLICGTSKNGGYNKERWGRVYDKFREVYPQLEEKYNEYISEFGYISKIKFVVTELGLGDLILRIACSLYA